MKLKHYLFYLTILSTLMGPNQIAAQDEYSAKEYDLKADFMYRFIDYVYWNNRSKAQPLEIAVLQDSPIISSLQQIIKGKHFNIKEYNTLKEIGPCQMLFIPKDCSVPIEAILFYYYGKPVLVITEKPGYGIKGAHMNFVTLNNKLKFEVNLKAIRKSGIGISSFLLQHAIIIQ
jgi:hypothetical protein